MKTRWPDSQTALRKPGVENGARRRRVYEDRGARISILAGRRPPRPDTLKQTDQPPISTKPLADGAGHTFSTQSARLRRLRRRRESTTLNGRNRPRRWTDRWAMSAPTRPRAKGRSPRQSPPSHCEREIGCINLAKPRPARARRQYITRVRANRIEEAVHVLWRQNAPMPRMRVLKSASTGSR